MFNLQHWLSIIKTLTDDVSKYETPNGARVVWRSYPRRLQTRHSRFQT